MNHTNPNGKRYCFHADESFVNPINRKFQVVRIVEGESGYTPVMEHRDLTFCQDTAKAMNAEHRLSDEDVLDIRTSSMRQHNLEHPDNPFSFTVDTEIGVTYTPWTDGWAIGFKVTAKDQPERWIFLNPSNSDTVGEANCFVYVEAEDVSAPSEAPGNSQCYINVYDPALYGKGDRVLTYCTYCEETVQTNGDQVPTNPEVFDELVDNFGRLNEPEHNHKHALYYQVVA